MSQSPEYSCGLPVHQSLSTKPATAYLHCSGRLLAAQLPSIPDLSHLRRAPTFATMLVPVKHAVTHLTDIRLCSYPASASAVAERNQWQAL